MTIKQYCRIKLTKDVPEKGLSVGDEGYVVEVLEGINDCPTGYMIELPTEHPQHQFDAVPTLTADQLEVIEPPLDVSLKSK